MWFIHFPSFIERFIFDHLIHFLANGTVQKEVCVYVHKRESVVRLKSVISNLWNVWFLKSFNCDSINAAHFILLQLVCVCVCCITLLCWQSCQGAGRSPICSTDHILSAVIARDWKVSLSLCLALFPCLSHTHSLYVCVCEPPFSTLFRSHNHMVLGLRSPTCTLHTQWPPHSCNEPQSQPWQNVGAPQMTLNFPIFVRLFAV